MEGPPLKVIAETLSTFIGKKVILANGSAKIQYEAISGEDVQDVFTVGKNLFIQFAELTLRIHFLMFGSYRVNEIRKDQKPRLYMKFENDTLSFYNCPVSVLRNYELKKLYDKEVDIISNEWKSDKVISLASNMKDEYVCDVLLDQSVFAGVGNIIKNEALYMAGVHPLSIISKIPSEKLQEVVAKAREFSLLFYEVKKEGRGLDSYLRIYRQRQCKKKRVSYFCTPFQTIYA